MDDKMYVKKHETEDFSLNFFLLPTTPTLESYNYECFITFIQLYLHTRRKGDVCSSYVKKLINY